MTDGNPAPPLGADVDLRGMPFMPLDTTRLIDSDLFALSTGDEFKAALALWCKAWQQVPASSLPNDDRVLAHLSGAGAKWRKVKALALRGFVLCSDGRLYHPVIAEKALEAWASRSEFDNRREHERERQRRHREERARLFEQLRGCDVVPAFDTPTARLRELLTHALVTRDSDVTVTVTPPSHVTEPSQPATAKTGTETVKRQRQGQGVVKQERTRRPETPLPVGFAISDRVRAWAVERGHDRLDERLEHFVGKARAKDYRYADWDEGFMGAIRDDWAKLNGKPPNGSELATLSPAGRATAQNVARWIEGEERKDAIAGS